MSLLKNCIERNKICWMHKGITEIHLQIEKVSSKCKEKQRKKKIRLDSKRESIEVQRNSICQ